MLRWVRDEAVYEVWQKLSELGLGEHGAGEILDTVSCPGTDSCKLGITSSMGLNGAINAKLKELDITDPLTKRIHIKNSGCPNGCGQHHIANIGFYGASIKVGDKTIPAYIPHVGGNYEGGEVIYATAAEVAPARQARARGRRAVAEVLRGPAPGRRGVQRLRRPRRPRARSPSWWPTCPCRWTSTWRT